MATQNEQLLNEGQAAAVLGWSPKNLQRRRWLRQEPKFLKVGRLVKYRMTDLQDFLDRCVIEPRGV